MNKILKILDYTEKNKYYRFLYYLFCPIFYLFDLLCFYYYWNKIKTEILTNDDLISFLDTNEFGYRWNKLYKIDIIEPNSFMDQFSLDEMEVKIKFEFTNEFTKKISENTAFDVENYINLHVITSIIPENKIKKYQVDIRYYRYYLIENNFKWLILWCILFFSLIIVLKELLINV